MFSTNKGQPPLRIPSRRTLGSFFGGVPVVNTRGSATEARIDRGGDSAAHGAAPPLAPLFTAKARIDRGGDSAAHGAAPPLAPLFTANTAGWYTPGSNPPPKLRLRPPPTTCFRPSRDGVALLAELFRTAAPHPRSPSSSSFAPAPSSAALAPPGSDLFPVRALLPLPRLISMWILLPLFVVSASASGASDDAVALLAFKARADRGNRLPFFTAANVSSSDNEHCRWHGVWCSADGRVIRLVLEAAGLAGVFAGGTLDRLDQLRILSLKANSLTGPLPDLSPLLNLKALFLSRNRFVGAFPASVLSLHRLRTLDLSYNNLSGPIPPSLAALDRLYALRLESNLFSGPIPPLNQSSLVNFNVSHNNFSGTIPATAALSSFAASAFAANPGLCGGVLRKECGGGNVSRTAPSPGNAVAGEHEGIRLPSSASPAQKMHKRAVVAVGFLASSFLVIGVLGFSLLMHKKRSRMKRGAILGPVKHQANGAAEAPESNLENLNAQIENGSNELMAAASLAMSEEKVKKLSKSGCLVFCAGEATVYNLQQLMKASAEMLGRGSAGSTYKAVLENRLMVSVKRLDAAKLVATGKEVFERHMEMVGRLRHPNLVPLRAYFKAKEERLLVYDYQPNGSLSSLVHGMDLWVPFVLLCCFPS
ncbi:hypothetical protein B296_00053726 [Ensete ventricosum]|uniref:Protein kinase domain-containing protein n=1 Tax=Ensete ventricosum TaxID=4639 RepID=A0A426XMI7_ENSVE|nr:hypothetical protein B296_00053726 [Ensete ventricosum]